VALTLSTLFSVRLQNWKVSEIRSSTDVESICRARARPLAARYTT
jgi:hypothetical protein